MFKYKKPQKKSYETFSHIDRLDFVVHIISKLKIKKHI
jgi:hypothetical protein